MYRIKIQPKPFINKCQSPAPLFYTNHCGLLPYAAIKLCVKESRAGPGFLLKPSSYYRSKEVVLRESGREESRTKREYKMSSRA